MAAREQFLGPSLGSKAYLVTRCTRCDLAVRMTAAAAVARFGWHARPYLVRQKSPCLLCKSAEHIEIRFR